MAKQSQILRSTHFRNQTVSSRSESETQSQNDSNQGQNLKSCRSAYLKPRKAAVLFLLAALAVVQCNATGDAASLVPAFLPKETKYDPFVFTKEHLNDTYESCLKKAKESKNNLAGRWIKERIMWYDETLWTMEPVSIHETIAGRFIGDGTHEALKKARNDYADELEKDFDIVFKKLIKEMRLKEELVAYLEDKGYLFSGSFEEKLDITRYKGRAHYLEHKTTKLANIYWENSTETVHKNDYVIRQGHMNVLAIGLSNETSGFAEAYKIPESFDFYTKILEVMDKKCDFLDKSKPSGSQNKAFFDVIGGFFSEKKDDFKSNVITNKVFKMNSTTYKAKDTCQATKRKFEEARYMTGIDMCPTCKGKGKIKKEKCKACTMGRVRKEGSTKLDGVENTTLLTDDHIAKLSKLYYEWTYEHKVPMEEMFVLHSNSDPTCGSMDDDARKPNENRPMWNYPGDHDLDNNYRITYRMGRVLTMMLRAELEIMTLVELDCYEFFGPILEILGYDSCFQGKIGRINDWTNEAQKDNWSAKHNAGTKFWHKKDGAAIFWLTHKFEVALEGKDIIDKHCQCLRQDISTADKENGEWQIFNKNTDPEHGNERHHNIFIGKDAQGAQVAMDMVFRIKNSEQMFGIITGHLKSGKLKKDWAKKKEIVEAVAERAKYLRHAFAEENHNIPMPMIISGDINTAAVTEGNTYAHMHNILNNTFKAPDRAHTGYKYKASPCPMLSSYPETMATKFAERKAGNQPNKIMCVREAEDYQLHTMDMVPTSRMFLQCTQADHNFDASGVTFLEQMAKFYKGGSPNGAVPSDHIPLATEFVIKRYGNARASEIKQMLPLQELRKIETERIFTWGDHLLAIAMSLTKMSKDMSQNEKTILIEATEQFIDNKIIKKTKLKISWPKLVHVPRVLNGHTETIMQRLFGSTASNTPTTETPSAQFGSIGRRGRSTDQRQQRRKSYSKTSKTTHYYSRGKRSTTDGYRSQNVAKESAVSERRRRIRRRLVNSENN